MARVNIEEQAFGDSRLSKLAKLLLRSERATFDDCRHVAMGLLVFLWHGSQEAGRESGSTSEIDRWCDFDGAAQLLLDSGYLSNDGECIVIRGNKEQFASIEEWRQRKSKAGRASVAARTQKYGSSRPRKRDEQNTNTVHQNTNTCSEFAEQNTNTVHQNTNTVHSVHTNRREQTRTERTQYNSIQYNSLQERKKEEDNTNMKSENDFHGTSSATVLKDNSENIENGACELPPKVKKRKKLDPVQGGSAVWQAYADSMLKNWGHVPSRNDKTNAQCCQLIRTVGYEKAVAIAEYYPTRRRQDFVQNGHPFGAMLTNVSALEREISAGIKLTKEVVKKIVEREESENYEKAVSANILSTDPFALEPSGQLEITSPKLKALGGGFDKNG